VQKCFLDLNKFLPVAKLTMLFNMPGALVNWNLGGLEEDLLAVGTPPVRVLILEAVLPRPSPLLLAGDRIETFVQTHIFVFLARLRFRHPLSAQQNAELVGTELIDRLLLSAAFSRSFFAVRFVAGLNFGG